MTYMALKMPGQWSGRRAGRRHPLCWKAPRAVRHQGMRWRTAQAAVEYILTTLVLVTCFAAMYGFIQGQLKVLFILAGKKILTTYY